MKISASLTTFLFLLFIKQNNKEHCSKHEWVCLLIILIFEFIISLIYKTMANRSSSFEFQIKCDPDVTQLTAFWSGLRRTTSAAWSQVGVHHLRFGIQIVELFNLISVRDGAMSGMEQKNGTSFWEKESTNTLGKIEATTSGWTNH